MGADGGSIPKRAELVKTKSRSGELANDQRQAYLDNFCYCALSKESLRAPVVICRLGRLYNKEAVLKHLLAHKMKRKGSSCEAEEPTALDRSVAHIRTSKDVRLLRLTENPAAREEEGKGVTGDCPRHFPFICPVTGKEMNGHFRFCFLKGCGCVFSEQALKEISTKTCPTCSRDREANDLEDINPESPRQISGPSDGQSSHNKTAATRPEALTEVKRPFAELGEPADFTTEGLDDELEPRGEEGALTSRPAVFKRSAAISALYKR